MLSGLSFTIAYLWFSLQIGLIFFLLELGNFFLYSL